MRRRLSQAILLVACLPMAARAGGGLVLQPVPTAGESVRFDRGAYLMTTSGPRATVELRSALGEGGDIAFALVVRNTGPLPINMDVSDVRVEGGESGVHVLTRAELDHKAEHHAGWAKFWTGLGGSLAATIQANQRDHYRYDTTSRYGSWSTIISAPCESCRADADRTWAATSARVQGIQDGLDAKRAAYREQALQITTVDPGQVYASRIALSHFKPAPMGTMRLIVSVGGDAFTFAFRFAPDGTPAPAYDLAAAPPVGPAPVVGLSWVRPTAAALAPPIETAPVRAIPVAYVPAGAPISPVGRAQAGIRDQWRRYYTALIVDGVSREQAKEMADQEVGPLD